MLKLQFKDNRRQPFWVMENAFSIGSDRENNLVLEDPSVEGVHAHFVSQGDSFLIKASGESAQVKVNGERAGSNHLLCGDLITIGDVELQVVDPLDNTASASAPYWSFIADSSWLSGQEFPLQALPGTSVTLGRSSQCDIVFAGTHLSRQHASILVGRDSLTISDMDSANGTFVNGKRVQEASLKPGDQVRLDVYTFRVFGPGIDLPASSTTARFAAVTDKDIEQALAKSRKSWKTRPTSPGNREEPKETTQSKVFVWVSAAVILTLFGTALFMVLGS